MGQPLRRCLAFAAAVALAACRPPSPPEEPPAAPPVTPEEQAAQVQRYEELAARLAPEGAEALAGLSSAPDPGHGAVFYQGRVPDNGSTAYLRLVQLGSGAGTLRLVVRYQGADWIEADQGTIAVDGRTVGEFLPQKIRAERTDDGVVQLFDADADLLRPALTALLEADAAEIVLSGPRGPTVIRLDAPQLAEMRQFFAASLHLPATGTAP